MVYHPTPEETNQALQNQQDQNARFFEAIIERVHEQVQNQAETGEPEPTVNKESANIKVERAR
jgi:hypothetical protein